MVREITKLHEEVIAGNLSELADRYHTNPVPKGELVLVVGPAEKQIDYLRLRSPPSWNNDYLNYRFVMLLARWHPSLASLVKPSIEWHWPCKNPDFNFKQNVMAKRYVHHYQKEKAGRYAELFILVLYLISLRFVTSQAHTFW